MVDGHHAGTIGDGESQTVFVEPGRHTVQVRLGSWFRSRTVDVIVAQGQETRLLCKARVSGMNLLPNPRNYIDLRTLRADDILP
jgi:hypothetical protein